MKQNGDNIPVPKTLKFIPAVYVYTPYDSRNREIRIPI
jgi:hypothetical protein